MWEAGEDEKAWLRETKTNATHSSIVFEATQRLHTHFSVTSPASGAASVVTSRQRGAWVPVPGVWRRFTASSCISVVFLQKKPQRKFPLQSNTCMVGLIPNQNPTKHTHGDLDLVPRGSTLVSPEATGPPLVLHHILTHCRRHNTLQENTKNKQTTCLTLVRISWSIPDATLLLVCCYFLVIIRTSGSNFISHNQHLG